MKFQNKISLLCLLIIVSINIGFSAKPATNSNKSSDRKYVPGQVIVKFKNEVGKVETSRRAQALMSKSGISSMRKVFPQKQNDQSVAIDQAGLGQIYVVSVPSVTDIPALAARLANDPAVQYAEPNYIAYTDSFPNDPSYSSEQHLPQVHAPEAWNIAQGDTNVILAVLDTGVDWDHPDLANAIWANYSEIANNGIDDDGDGYIDDTRGWDFVEGIVGGAGATDPDPNDDLDVQDNNPMDFQGHGTHVAGISGAVTNNGVGIASVVWKCKIMPLRIGFRTNDGGGSGTDEAMAQAFVYAGDHGATAANLSFGPIISQLVFDAARYAFNHGAVICNSAGNSGTEGISGLGAQPFALAVASVDKNNVKASYSSYGVDVDISAPGGASVTGDGGILSTLVNPSAFYGGQLYGRFQGTSMASPMVASLAGLIKSYHPTWSPAQIMFQIIGTADNIDGVNSTYAGKLGSGRINAFRALTETPAAPAPKLSFGQVVVSDAGGNNDGKLDPGESGTVIVQVDNDWGDATGITVSFVCNNSAIIPGNTMWNLGNLPGLSDYENAYVTNSAAPFTLSVHAQAVPMIIPCTLTMTADGGINITKEFYLSISPSVLFVDDHAGGGDGSDAAIESYFSSGFQNKNIAYTTWDRGAAGTPPVATLDKYSVVVWGCEWAFPSIDSTDRAHLGTYLDGGGRLFISGQDIGWDMCDPAGGEYTASSGASKTWYETYLGAKYLSDDANGSASNTAITGVTSDPIGDGFNFSAAEPARDATNQYPDVIQALSGATDVFRYANNSSAAVRYSGTHQSVYFSFGGLEAITNSSTRDSVFLKVYSWLQQSSLDFTRLTDQEDSASPSPVIAQVLSSLDVVQSVDLYWDTDGTFPYNVIPMANLGEGSYSAPIPAQNTSTDVHYFVLVKTSGGSIPVDFRSYHVGLDKTSPQASFITTIAHSLKQSGPFSVEIEATDNISVDTNSIYLIYSINGGATDSVKLHQSSPDRFSATFSFASPAPGGSSISYYVRVRDGSASKNQTLLPANGTASFKIGVETIDDFETEKLKWNYGTSWGRTTSVRKYGLYSMADSPIGNYLPDATNTLTLIETLDLSGYGVAKLYFWKQHFLGTFDTVFVEQSTNGINWTTSKFFKGTTSLGWVPDTISLPAGAGANTVSVRFRLRSHPPSEANGIFLDDLIVKTDTFLLTGVNELAGDNKVPASYSLSQNYPNPFNPLTIINYQLTSANFTTIKIYNLLGQEVAQLVNELKQPGTYEVTWDASNMPSGMYFYRMVSGQFSDVKKMLLIK